MNTNKTKNVLLIILVAVISSVVTLLGFSAVNKDSRIAVRSSAGGSAEVASKEITAYSNQFDQDRNVVLTNLTTSEGYPDFTVAAARSVDGVVHVKTKSISQQQYFNPFDFFFGFGDRTPSQPREQVGFGSGVIISKDGYIITNNHVVDEPPRYVTLNTTRRLRKRW